MDFFDGLPEAISSMQSWAFVLAFALGCANGMLTGLLPGLGGSVGIALMIPFTYGMDTATAMGLFVAALAGQNFCGSITAILLNVPGSSPSAATTIDGYPLARQGRGGFAIGISASASFLGSLFGTIVLIALIPVVRSVILSFSFPEFTMLGIMGLTIIAMASRGSMVKGVVAGLLGLLVSFVGFAPIGGDIRYVFDQPALFGGFDVVIVLVGMFSVTEALSLLKMNQSVAKDTSQLAYGHKQVWEGVAFTLKQPALLLRSSLIGLGVGLVPAVGGTVAAFLAYFQAAKTVKDPKFGSGDPRGVLAPEASNDAKDSGAALPSLAFGIPGSSDWAIVLGAMVLHGVTPGPNLIKESPDIIWVAIIVLIAASFASSALGLLFAPQLLKVTKVKPGLLSPTVLMLAAVGAYALNLSTFEVVVSLVFGLIGYVMRQIGMPMIPLILGFMLGPMVERSYLQTMSTFGPTGFVARPIALVLLLITVAIIVYEVVLSRRSKGKDPAALDQGVQSAIKPMSLIAMAALGVIGLVAVAMATRFSPSGREFPLLAGGLMFALVCAFLAVALVPSLRARFGAFISDGGGMEELAAQVEHEAVDLIESQQGTRPEVPGYPEKSPDDTAHAGAVITEVETVERVPTRQELREMSRRLRLSLLLVVGIIVLTVLFGIGVAVPVIFVLFLTLVTRESWRTVVVSTVCVVGTLYLVFVTLLGVPLNGGTLLSY